MRKLDPTRAQWGTTAELLAGLIEIVDVGNRMFFAANMKGTVPDPVVIPRPKAPTNSDPEPDEPRMATASEMKAFFSGATVEYTP